MLFDMFEYQLWLLFSLSTWPLVTSPITLNFQTPISGYWKYSSFIINSTLTSIKAMLSSKLTYKLPDADYCYELLFSALLNLEPRGVWTSGSAHVLWLTTLYSCLSISSTFLGLWGFLEVLEVFQEFRSNLQLEHSPEIGEHWGQVGS